MRAPRLPWYAQGNTVLPSGLLKTILLSCETQTFHLAVPHLQLVTLSWHAKGSHYFETWKQFKAGHGQTLSLDDERF